MELRPVEIFANKIQERFKERLQAKASKFDFEPRFEIDPVHEGKEESHMVGVNLIISDKYKEVRVRHVPRAGPICDLEIDRLIRAMIMRAAQIAKVVFETSDDPACWFLFDITVRKNENGTPIISALYETPK